MAKLNCIRTLSTIKPTNGEKVSISVFFPRICQMPDIFQQPKMSILEQIEEKSKKQKCDNCGANYRKYL